MKSFSSLIILLYTLFFANVIFAQINNTRKDTSNVVIIREEEKNRVNKTDTVLYNKIQKYSEKSKVGRLLHKALFESREVKNANPVRRPKKKEYTKYEGKIIRNINIETLDPFGFSATDTTKAPKNWAENAGNKLHIKSKNFAIRNLTLLRKNKPLDSLLVQESERLIRNQRFVSQVYITAELTEKNSDSVDVTVRRFVEYYSARFYFYKSYPF